ncbi:hypothetical protein HZS_2654 [Henneguya salminicola]|nr:hypothetical protein HZS_2654 [Henneguya salminicola]
MTLVGVFFFFIKYGVSTSTISDVAGIGKILHRLLIIKYTRKTGLDAIFVNTKLKKDRNIQSSLTLEGIFKAGHGKEQSNLTARCENTTP